MASGGGHSVLDNHSIAYQYLVEDQVGAPLGRDRDFEPRSGPQDVRLDRPKNYGEAPEWSTKSPGAFLNRAAARRASR